jgi:hypothetical protein
MGPGLFFPAPGLGRIFTAFDYFLPRLDSPRLNELALLDGLVTSLFRRGWNIESYLTAFMSG